MFPDKRLPAPSSFLQNLVAQLDFQSSVGNVYENDVSILDKGDGAARGGFRAHVTDAGTACAPAKPAVGNQRHGFPQSHSHNLGCGRQHLLHPRAAFGPFVADDHHVAGLDLSAQDPLHRFLLGVEDDGRAPVDHHFRGNARGLDNRAFRGQIAEEDGKSSILTIRIPQGANNLGVPRILSLDVLP